MRSIRISRRCEKSEFGRLVDDLESRYSALRIRKR